MKKYKLIEPTTHPCGRTLYRIQALIALPGVLIGDIGGYIESEDNLSHTGNAWVFDNALVCDKAKIYDNARVCDNAKVGGNAKVYGNGKVFDDAKVGDNAQVFSNAQVYCNARVCGNAWVRDNARVWSNAKVRYCLFFQQPRHNITATDTHVFIGCEGHTWEYWDKNVGIIGKKHEYTHTEINNTKDLLRVVKAQIKGRTA